MSNIKEDIEKYTYKEIIINSPTYGMKSILLDDKDWSLVNKYRWYVNKVNNSFYAQTNIHKNGNNTILRMHNLIMNVENGNIVDHRDGNGLDNRRFNLRLATQKQNLMNRGKTILNTSGFKGVSWHKGTQKWQTNISVNGKTKCIGVFDDPVKAAKAYDFWAIDLHGEFAKTNFNVIPVKE